MRDHTLEPEHIAFRELVRHFITREIVPRYEDWERAGIVDQELWLAAGATGLLGMDVPTEHGGGGVADIRYQIILTEELARAGTMGVGFGVQNDIVAPYLIELTTDEQKARWLPGFCSGQTISAIAITEPDGGSDLQAIRTSAVLDGDAYVLNGSKSFVTNGVRADLIVVAAVTDPDRRKRDGGLSLLAVEGGMAGLARGPAMAKIGMHAQDTADLAFTDVRVPVENLLGTAGRATRYLATNLRRERLSIAVAAVAGAEAVFAETLDYCRTRTAFGQPIGSFQHNRFTLAEIATELDIARTYLDHCVSEFMAGRMTPADAASAKWWTTDLQHRVVDRCLQLHGGAGLIRESRVARAYVDTRMMPIYGGTNEIMKEIIGRSLGI